MAVGCQLTNFGVVYIVGVYVGSGWMDMPDVRGFGGWVGGGVSGFIIVVEGVGGRGGSK